MNDSPEPVDLSPNRDELIARVRARGRQIRARRRLAIAGVAALVVVGVAAPAIAIGTRSSTTSTIPPAVSTTAAPSKPNDITVSIEVPSTTVAVGGVLRGEVVVTNNTDRPINLDPPGECTGKWAVALTSATASQNSMWTQECASGRPSRTLEPGVNHWPFTLATNYSGCVSDTTQGPGPDVLCVSYPGGPDLLLPAGQYEAVLKTNRPDYLPAAPPVPVRIVTAIAPPPDLGELTLRTGARTTKMLVPAGWTLKIEDGGGSGSSSTWTNPADANEEVFGATGAEVGAWYETDGVKGSITPGNDWIPAAAQVDRVNYTTFRFHVDAADGNDADGVWIALVTADGPLAYVVARVQLPPALHATATAIIDRFISDTNKRVPPYPGP